MTFALIPAAGRSRRMGRPKLSLPLGDRTVLEWVVIALRTAGVRDVLVVAGPHVPELVPLADEIGASTLLLPEETPDMRATVERGLSWLEHSRSPVPEDDWLLVPADHPALDAAAVGAILLARQGNPASSLIVPTYQGRRGHPALIGWRHVPGIRALPAGEGINSYFRRHASDVLEWPVDSPAVLRDLDTPEDYEALRRSWAARSG